VALVFRGVDDGMLIALRGPMEIPFAAIGAAAAAGLASSLHCAAMCGPLALAVCGAPGREGLRAGLRYGGGRLAAYALTGSIAGALGSRLVRLLRGEHVQQVVSLALAAGLVFAAVRVLRARTRSDLVPLRARREGARPPALAAGLLTGFLPCGALAAGLMIAAGAATWWGGALAMSSFALASAPGLAAVVLAGASVGGWLRGAVTPGRRRAFGVALVLVAAWVAARPWVMPERSCRCRASAAETAGLARPS
jgi:sulfite exporter TauE/SafE